MSEKGSKAPEELVELELGRQVYVKADELRLAALERTGVSLDNLPKGTRHKVTLRSPSYRLQVELAADAERVVGEDSLRLVAVRNRPYREGQDTQVFETGRFIEPDGSLWVMADSSQGEPWYSGRLQREDLAEILGCLNEIQSTNYLVDVSLTAYQQV